LDNTNSGKIDLTDIKVRFNPNKHPEVLLGKKGEDDVAYDFLDTFEAHFSQSGGKDDRLVSLEQWLQYFKIVGANIDNDDYFELMVHNSFLLA
jgi:hypothetical protein